jgi:hypothetical protein
MRNRACRFVKAWLALTAACGGQPFSADASNLDASSAMVANTASGSDTAPGPDAASVPDTARGAADSSMSVVDSAVADIRTIDVPAPSVTPAVTDQFLWLRADVGVTELNDGVLNWADSSANHLDARQADPTMEPIWLQGGVASRPAVVFNDASFLSLPTGFGDFSLGLSMFAITAVTDTTDSCVDLVDLSNGPLLDNITLGRHDGRVHYQVAGAELQGDLFTAGRAHLISVVHAPGRALSMRIDTGALTTAIFALPASTVRVNNVIGRSLYSGCGGLQGGIAEFILYRRALTDFERAQVESYLQDRWGCCR